MGSKNKIMIVDDEKANLLFLNHLLNPEYAVYSVRDAKETVKRASEYRPDLILLDIIMPEMSGYEVLSALKEHDGTKDIPIVFITGLTDRGDEMKGLNLGAEDYITKPFNDEIVKLRVRNQIKIVNQIRAIDRRLEQQKLMTQVAQSFLTDEHAGALFTKTLRMIGEFMEISQILLFRLEGSDTVLTCESEWIDPALNFKTRIGGKLNMEGPILALVDWSNSSSERFMLSSDPYVKETLAPYRIDFRNYITVPIFIKGKICAVLDFSKADETNEWSSSEIDLACLAASIFSGVFEREAIERDLNTVLKLKAELTVEKDRAERSSRAKGEFLSRMSHEMRTPMNAIIGMTALAKKTDDAVKRDAYLTDADTASKSLLRLIDNVLDISGIEEGQLDFVASEFRFAEMLKRVFNEAGSLFSEKSQSFITEIDPSIPEILICDEKRLAQVIAGLLSNAGKFTGERGEIRFKASVLRTEYGILTLQIEVADNGIGISENEKQNLFAAFEQGDGGIDRKYGGAGTGLYLSKSLVEMMGGEIWLESESGKGSVFIFTIKAQVKAPGVNADPPVSFRGLTALLVEDMEINREIVMAMLEETQLRFICAGNGREAVEIFLSDPSQIDFILMDINMPEMDGVEAARRIRSSEAPEGARVPIIAMTANVLPEQIKTYLETGMNDHIGKPIDFDKLVKMLCRHIA